MLKLQKGISRTGIIIIIVLISVAIVFIFSIFSGKEQKEPVLESSKLNEDDVKNTVYLTGNRMVAYKNGELWGWAELVNGQTVYHYWEKKPENKDGWEFRDGIEAIIMGDLNKDNKEDAAVIVSSWTGGSAVFKYLTILLNKNDKPVYTSSKILGDRVKIESISIKSNLINVRIMTHGPEDPMCCPTLVKNLAYNLMDFPTLERSGGVSSKTEYDFTDWLTYKNEKYGYEIQYPADWTYREYPDTGTGAGFRLKGMPENVQNEYINISIYGAAKPNANFDDYVKEAGANEIQNFEKINTIKEIFTKSGIKGYETTWNYKDFNGAEKISLPITYFKYPKSLNGLSTVQVGLANEDYETVYEQMLSTFKLIE